MSLKRRLKDIAKAVLPHFPAPPFAKQITLFLMRWSAETLPPEKALKLLFDVDFAMYVMQGRTASRYGGGVHAKHRIIGYYDFFCAHLSEGDKVMDVGCGKGELANAMATRVGVHVTGIDHNPLHIERASKNYASDKVEFRVGDASEAADEQGFDVVTLSNVLEHLHNRPEFLASLIKTGKEKFIIRVPQFDREWRVPLRKEVGAEWRLDLDHKTEYTIPEFYADLEAGGLEVLELSQKWGEIWAVAKPKAKND